MSTSKARRMGESVFVANRWLTRARDDPGGVAPKSVSGY